jgi:dipeptidyl aminopeptidase/acylaminoacyl peptidase
VRRLAAVGLAAAALVACADDESGGCQALALGDQRIESGFDTFVVEADGSTRRFSSMDGLAEPSVTPDGRLVAATRADGDVDDSDLLATTVVVLDADGEERSVVAGVRGTEDRSPALAPDGDRIAFVRVPDDGAGASLVVGDLDGGESTVLHEGREERLNGTSWSPDGRFVAVVRSPDRAGDDELLVIDASLGDVVLEVPWAGRSTAWSWDSSTVLGLGAGGVLEASVADGTVTEILAPPEVVWLDAVLRASDGAIVVLADGGHDGLVDRLDVIDPDGRALSSVELEAGLGVDRSRQPATIDSLAVSRCFRPG